MKNIGGGHWKSFGGVNDERFNGVAALLKTKDAHGLYGKYGFKDVDLHRVMYRPSDIK